MIHERYFRLSFPEASRKPFSAPIKNCRCRPSNNRCRRSALVEKTARLHFVPLTQAQPRPRPRPRPRPLPLGPPLPPRTGPPRSASLRALFLGFGWSSMSSVSSGSESGRIKYRIVEPRMFMVSSETASWPRGVILTVRSAVFICGETEVMVP